MSEKFDLVIQDLDISEIAQIRESLRLQHENAFLKLLDRDLNKTERNLYQARFDTLEKAKNTIRQISVERRIEQSWKDNPDRQGGQFSQEEMYRVKCI